MPGMTPGSKYSVNDPAFDPVHGVLRNTRGIIDPGALEQAESDCLIAAYETAALSYLETHRFSEADVCALHRLFLGPLFEWAGTYRMVDLSSGDIRWCHAAYIGAEMARFGARLSALTPFSPAMDRPTLLARLAELHGELVMIHPFRDGNGRVTRLLGDLLLMQAEHPPIQMGAFDDVEIRQEYHVAIRDVWMRAQYDRLIALLDRLVS